VCEVLNITLNGAGSVSEGAVGVGVGEGLEVIRVIFAGVLAEPLASAPMERRETGYQYDVRPFLVPITLVISISY
jgi:hypothetical protein